MHYLTYCRLWPLLTILLLPFGAHALAKGVSFTELRSWEEFEAAKRRATEQEKPLLIYLSGHTWCTGCTRLEDNILKSKDEAAKDFQQFLTDEFVRVRVNLANSKQTDDPLMDTPFVWSFFLSYGCMSTPRLIIANDKGEPAQYFMGFGADDTVESYVGRFKRAYQGDDGKTPLLVLAETGRQIDSAVSLGQDRRTAILYFLEFLNNRGVPVFDQRDYHPLTEELRVASGGFDEETRARLRYAYIYHLNHVHVAVTVHGSWRLDSAQLWREQLALDRFGSINYAAEIAALDADNMEAPFNDKEQDKFLDLIVLFADEVVRQARQQRTTGNPNYIQMADYAERFAKDHLERQRWLRGHRVELELQLAQALVLLDKSDEALQIAEVAYERATNDAAPEAKYTEGAVKRTLEDLLATLRRESK